MTVTWSDRHPARVYYTTAIQFAVEDLAAADSSSSSSGDFAYITQTGLQYVQLDLGAVYSVDKVRVWHYAADGRTHYGTKTQVSADGLSWYTVFDSAVSGTYVETAAGRTYTFPARNVRYVRDYLNGSNKNTGNHWVEIEVWGFRTTAYVGAHYEKDVTANTGTSYYYLGGQRIGVRRGGVLYYLHTDHLGSASLTTDASGNRVGEPRYKPYGETRTIWGAMRTDRRFTGQVEDAAIGLYFYNARYYDHALGRFISADTIVPQPGNPQALNRYSYCLGNPVRYTDPSGHYGKDVHYDLTQKLFYQALYDNAIAFGYSPAQSRVIAGRVALQVATADQAVDDYRAHPDDASTKAGTLHWYNHREARMTVAEAIESTDSIRVGRAMHALQDYFSHYGQGYTVAIGDKGQEAYLWGLYYEDSIPITGEPLESPVNWEHRLKNSRQLGHLNGPTIRAFVDEKTGRSPTYEYPDRFDPSDLWDQQMVSDSQHYANLFAIAYLNRKMDQRYGQ